MLMNPVENQTFGVEAAPSRTHPEAGMDVAEKIGPVFVMAFFLPLVLGDLSEGVVVVWLETVHPVRRCVCALLNTSLNKHRRLNKALQASNPRGPRRR
jgi:hypothetical protein